MSDQLERVATLEDLDEVLEELIIAGYIQEWPDREIRFRALPAGGVE